MDSGVPPLPGEPISKKPSGDDTSSICSGTRRRTHRHRLEKTKSVTVVPLGLSTVPSSPSRDGRMDQGGSPYFQASVQAWHGAGQGWKRWQNGEFRRTTTSIERRADFSFLFLTSRRITSSSTSSTTIPSRWNYPEPEFSRSEKWAFSVFLARASSSGIDATGFFFSFALPGRLPDAQSRRTWIRATKHCATDGREHSTWLGNQPANRTPYLSQSLADEVSLLEQLFRIQSYLESHRDVSKLF